MSSKTPKYIYVENRIREGIRDGSIVDQLPGERVLARELGISYMTIRKAIDNLVGEGVLVRIPSQGTYVNRAKKGKERTRNIGFYLDKSIESGITSPYYSMVFSEIESAATKCGYSLMYFSDFVDLISPGTIKKIDGVIISCFPRLEDKIHEIKDNVPVLVIGNGSYDKSIPSVVTDNFNAFVEPIEHLCSLGHTRIGYISGLHDSDIGLHRLKGFEIAKQRNGLAQDKELVYEGDYSYESGAKGAMQLFELSEPPTAIMCGNDTMAIGAIKAIRESGLQIPQDVSVIGFDDIAVASEIHPPLTTVAAPVKEIAVNSVRMLTSMIERRPLKEKHLALSTNLVVRQSCSKVSEA
jgi:DNA-binding LacI/PurR family transcriptional regulator